MTARAKRIEPPPDPALVEIARALGRKLAREDHEREMQARAAVDNRPDRRSAERK
jgi:hypothetical protein